MLDLGSKLAKCEMVVCDIWDGKEKEGRGVFIVSMRRLLTKIFLSLNLKVNTCNHPKSICMRFCHTKGDSPPL